MTTHAEAELAIITNAILDEEILYDVLSKLSPRHFHDEMLRNFFISMQKLVDTGKAVEFASVGFAYGDLTGNNRQKCMLDVEDLTRYSGNYYDKSLIDQLITRQKNAEVGLAIESAYFKFGKGHDADEIKEELIASIHKADDNQACDVFTSDEVFADYEDGLSFEEAFAKREADRLLGKSMLQGISYGYSNLDKATQGVVLKQIVVVGARTGVGKTQFCLNLISNWIKQGVPVGMISLEMPKEKLYHRLLGIISEVPREKIHSTDLYPSQKEEVFSAKDKIVSGKLVISDKSNISPKKVRALIWQMKQRVGAKIIVLDFLTLMTADKKHDNETSKVTDIIQTVQSIAKELNVCIIVIAQLNRDCEKGNRKPNISDFRDSGAIEQVADVILLLHRENINDFNDGHDLTDVIVAKTRGDGYRGTIKFLFDNRTTVYSEEKNSAIKTPPIVPKANYQSRYEDKECYV